MAELEGVEGCYSVLTRRSVVGRRCSRPQLPLMDIRTHAHNMQVLMRDASKFQMSKDAVSSPFNVHLN